MMPNEEDNEKTPMEENIQPIEREEDLPNWQAHQINLSKVTFSKASSGSPL